MRKYFEMKMLGKNVSWVRFAKKRKKWGEKCQNTAPGGWFYALTNLKRTQFASHGGAWMLDMRGEDILKWGAKEA
jgi:hypothetical protein